MTINPTTSQVKTTYTWTVSDADDNTALSDTDTLSFTVEIAPEKAPTPTVAVGSTQVTVGWVKPADAGISGWELKRDSGDWTAISPTETETLSHLVTGLTNGTEYSFQIRAVTGSGDDAVRGEASDSVRVTPTSADLAPVFEDTQRIQNYLYTVGDPLQNHELPVQPAATAC